MAGYDPPPFFRQGPAPLALLTFYIAVSIALQILDAKFRYLEVLRQAISVATYPVQVVAHIPARGISGLATYFGDIYRLQGDNERLVKEQLDNAPRLLRLTDLETENERLRKLLAIRDRTPGTATAARVLYSARDPFTRRMIVDRGLQHGVVDGQVVIDEVGVVGQVTRVFPLVSEVTLASDKDQPVPVKIVRNGLRSVSFGLGNGLMELRYMPANADVEVGDIIVTSGLDGLYPTGFPVARVDKIERDTTYSFARILCTPLAGIENHNTVLLLKPPAPEPAKPAELEAAYSGGTPVDKGARDRPRRTKR